MGWMLKFAEGRHYTSLRELGAAFGLDARIQKKKHEGQESPSEELEEVDHVFVDEGDCPFPRRKLLW